jgi:2-hydroxy-6-oxonona-2,4-dienedioate hydrolase
MPFIEFLHKNGTTVGFEDTPFIRKVLHNQQDSTLEGISLLLTAYRANLPKMVKSLKVPCLILYGNRQDKTEKIQKKRKEKNKKA